MNIRMFGEIPGTFEGQEFDNRIELSLSNVHKPRQAGISGSQTEGADSIVLSGGYEDDEDFGHTIIYTGHGGRDIRTGKQVSNQELVKQNLALAVSCQRGLPVRVIRGESHKSSFSPRKGYRYDGLYRIESYWREKGKSGYYVWRYRLVKIPKDLYKGAEIHDMPETYGHEYGPPKRVETSIQRIVRDTIVSRQVKELYNYKCQVCGVSIETNSGVYAEAAHIKPLGSPHEGPDTIDNVLCLCPNHHVKFDYGGFAILDDFDLIGEPGRLQVSPKHKINIEYIRYHREHFYLDR